MLREVKLILSRPLYLLSSVGAVMVSIFFFMTLMEGGVAENMPVSVVDLDQTSISRRLIHEMQATPSVDIKMITNSYPEAREAMQQGKIYGIFIIPEGFYRDIVSFKRPRMDFYITNAYTLGGNTAYKQMLTISNLVSGAFQREVLRKKGMPEEVIMKRIQPIVVEGHMLSNPWGNYTIYLVSTIMPGIIGLIALMLTIYSVGTELKNRTSIEWLIVAGDNYTTAMIGKLIPYTIIYQTLGIACHIILYNVADFPVQGSHVRLLFGMLLFIMAMEIMGIVIIGCIPILRDALSVGALTMPGKILKLRDLEQANKAPVIDFIANLRPNAIHASNPKAYIIGAIQRTLRSAADIKNAKRQGSNFHNSDNAIKDRVHQLVLNFTPR